MPTESDFLREIAARPDDVVLRLAYADWLDEHPNPAGGVRAELVRIEEEMWHLPVFADRYWDLKPRRNDLRRASDPEWLAALGYGTAHDPVTGYSPAYETIFAHGIPDGWKERWRLIRAFTEVWYGIPMADVGGRSAEVAKVEARLGRTLPPAVREWVAFSKDVEVKGEFEIDLRKLPKFAGYAIARSDDDGGGRHLFVRDGIEDDDPPLETVNYLIDESGSRPRRRYEAGTSTEAHTVTTFVLTEAMVGLEGEGRCYAFVSAVDATAFLARMRDEFPVHADFQNGTIFESPELRVFAKPHANAASLGVNIWGRRPSRDVRDTIPRNFWAFLTAIAKRDGRNTLHSVISFCEAFNREPPPSGRRISLIDE